MMLGSLVRRWPEGFPNRWTVLRRRGVSRQICMYVEVDINRDSKDSYRSVRVYNAS